MLNNDMEKQYNNAAHLDPICSPWGAIEETSFLATGVYSVCTSTHGGIMVHKKVADQVLSPEAQKCCYPFGDYLCYEEDCDAPVAIREFLDKGLMKAPVNDYFKKGEYSRCINESLQQWHPDYWQIYEQKAKQRKSKDREER